MTSSLEVPFRSLTLELHFPVMNILQASSSGLENLYSTITTSCRLCPEGGAAARSLPDVVSNHTNIVPNVWRNPLAVG